MYSLIRLSEHLFPELHLRQSFIVHAAVTLLGHH